MIHQQKTLFDPPPPVDNARRSDPSSSHDAARRVNTRGYRARNKAIVLDLVKRYPDRTAVELAELTEDVDRIEISRRLPDLRKEKLITNPYSRKCRIKDTNMQTWRAA